MHQPYNVRPEDYRYCLRTNDAYGWETGRTADGIQVLHCKANWLLFDENGHCIRAGTEAVSFQDEPIHVLRFWIPERWMGIEDLDSELALVYTDPVEAVMEPSDIDAWVRAGQFVFHCGWGDYVMGPEGQVVSS